jgi:hypothetical protein
MASVYICYARVTWTRENIIYLFNTAFDDDDIVERVDEREMSDTNGYKFKMFFVVFSHSNELFQEMVLGNKEAMKGIVYDPAIGERIENYFKFTSAQEYWNISPAKIRIRLEDETPRIERIKEVDRVRFFEAEYIEEEPHNTLVVKSIRLL